jgi:hypothetical protein
MHARSIGPVLRLVGPLVQVACLAALMGSGRRAVGGVAVSTLAYAGFALGFVLVVVGLLLSRRR